MSILNTKLYTPPARAKVVARPRLLDRITEGVAGRLTLVSAPAGFGKTTLVSSWLSQHDQPVAWLSLDERDSDFTRFLTYLIAALQAVKPGLGDGIMNMLKAPQPPTAEAILTELHDEISSVVHAFILVLDDYHVIDAPPVDEALNFLIEHLPPQMHVVITTREDPPLPLPRLRARGQLTELRAEDLRFIPSEAAQFLNEVMGLNLSAENIATLEARTEGWIAGLQLAALSVRGRSDPAGFIEAFTGSHRYVADYLIAEVLEQQPEGIQTFLLHTSFLDRLSGPLCDAVLETASSQKTLEDLLRANLFVIPLDDERRWYRYHHLFADILRRRLQENLSSNTRQGSLSELQRRAGNWFDAEGLHHEAIRYMLAAQDFDRAADIIEMIGPVIRRSRQEVAMFNWLKALPEELIRVRPVLCAEYVWALISIGQLAFAEDWFNYAVQWEDAAVNAEARQKAVAAGMVVANEEEFRSLPMRIAIYQAIRAQAQGDVLGTAKYAQRTLDLSTEKDVLARGAATAMLGIASWVSGDLETAYRSFSTGMAHLTKEGSFSDVIGGTLVLADIRVVQGRLTDVKKLYEESLQLAQQQGKPVLIGTADLHGGLSDLCRRRGDLETAARHLEVAEKLGEGAALPEHRFRRSVAAARLQQAKGDLKSAFDLLEEAERLQQPFPIPEMRPVAALKARVLIAQGHLMDAQTWALEHRLSSKDDLSFLREFEHITLARLMIAHYEREESAEELLEVSDFVERLLAAAEEGGRTGRMVEILLLRVWVQQTQGKSISAMSSLEHALNLAESEGIADVFLNEGGFLQDLLRRLVTSSSEGRSFARHLLSLLSERTGPMTDSTQRGAASDLVEPLTPREIEILRLIPTGMTNQEIADHLFISLATVKRHISNVYGKMDVRHRMEAVVRARELNLL
ncbi:MAG: LuxR C-terminal-related transcriptional regulator [Rhodothermaceae bacterium]|nr:LuxR C-terminal-related transcriptional regulator [Rhodothermaceae bacterium]